MSDVSFNLRTEEEAQQCYCILRPIADCAKVCAGSKCMYWRWSVGRKIIDGKVVSWESFMSNKRHAEQAPASIWVLPAWQEEWETVGTLVGYCGLAGRPPEEE